jgi:hypothetical protein
MELSALATAQSGGAATQDNAALRDADFMSLMLAEITNQDPFNPTETSKMVEGMQQLQELANSRYTKFRDDIRWAQDLMGSEVSVTQANVTAAEAQRLSEQGLNPDVGFSSVQGNVEGFRVVDEQVWMRIDGNDYPLDNVRSISPNGGSGDALGAWAERILGREVTWFDSEAGEFISGTAERLSIRDGTVYAAVSGGHSVAVNEISGISVSNPATGGAL